MKSVEEQRRANENYLLPDGLGSAAFRGTFGSVFILKSIAWYLGPGQVSMAFPIRMTSGLGAVAYWSLSGSKNSK
jgi:hypothetical protein